MNKYDQRRATPFYVFSSCVYICTLYVRAQLGQISIFVLLLAFLASMHRGSNVSFVVVVFVVGAIMTSNLLAIW